MDEVSKYTRFLVSLIRTMIILSLLLLLSSLYKHIHLYTYICVGDINADLVLANLIKCEPYKRAMEFHYLRSSNWKQTPLPTGRTAIQPASQPASQKQHPPAQLLLLLLPLLTDGKTDRQRHTLSVFLSWPTQ